jgi:hypothetical protein
MDLGLWATWYDVDPADEGEFLDWTHSTYLPSISQRAGMTWVAHYRNTGGGETTTRLQTESSRRGGDDEVPTGCQYLLLVGAPSTYTFFNPYVLDFPESDEVMKRLASRKRDRTEFYAEETRVDGCDVENRLVGSTSGPAIQFGCFRMRTIEAETTLARWYAQQRLPLMSQMAACVRTRKFISTVGWAKHAVLYEFSSLEARMREYEQPHESKTLDANAWTGQIASNASYPPGSPFVGERIWPPVAA